ncbi:putative ankyrin repeat-containing domain-containing protein [Helianthus debilis subsp. tardiflorus]
MLYMKVRIYMPIESYIQIGVSLYEASITCDWEVAEAIFDKNRELKLETCSITENGETPLHVAVSSKGHKHAELFVKKLVERMQTANFELKNKSYNTALYLAAAAGNIKAVKIMVEKKKVLLTIAVVTER